MYAIVSIVGMILLTFLGISLEYAYSSSGGDRLIVDPITDIAYVSFDDYTLGINGSSGVILKNISVTGDMAIDSIKQRLYVFNENVTMVNLTNSKVLTVVPMPNSGFSIDFDANKDVLYAADDESMTGLAALNGTDRSVKGYNTSEIIAWGLAVNPITNRVYIVDRENAYLHVFDPFKERMISNISLMNDAHDIVINPLTNYVYVSNSDGSRISIISGFDNKLKGYIFTGPVGENNYDRLAINAQKNILYLVDSSRNQLTIINGTSNKIMKKLPLGISPSYVSVNPNTGDVFVFDENSLRVAKITNNSRIVPIFGYNVIPNSHYAELDTIRISTSALEMSLNSENGLMYVLAGQPNATYIIDTKPNLLKGRIDLPYKPSHIEILPKLNQIILSYRDKPNIFSINLDSNKTTKEYHMPVLSAFDADVSENRIYAATATEFEDEGFQTFYDLNSTLYTFSIMDDYPSVQNTTARSLNAIALNSVSGKLYLSGNNFQIIDIPLNVTTVLGGNSLADPTKIAIDTKRNLVYVLGNNPLSTDFSVRANTLYIIDGVTDKIIGTRNFDADLIDIEINDESGYAYISASAPSSESGRVGVIFVIDGAKNHFVKDIVLGENPSSMVIDQNENKIYVLDSGLGSIYLIDGATNEPVSARSAIQFETNPHNSGDIFCNNVRVNDLIVEYGYRNKVDCQAKAYPKFKFASWSGAAQGTMGNTSFEVSSDSKIVAKFEELPSPLTLTEWIIIITGALIAVPAIFFIKDRLKKSNLLIRRRK